MSEIDLKSLEFPADSEVGHRAARHPYLSLFGHGSPLSRSLRRGTSGNKIETRKDFIDLIPEAASILEIGPYFSPIVSGRNVKYFDILSRDEMIVRATAQGVENPNPPQIDYVSTEGNLAIVEERFDFVVSSYCIEHQPDLIKHLQDVQNVLEDDGYYFALVPDKRYCHDHFMAESTIADVVDAHHNKRSSHPLGSVIEHVALSAHNDHIRHWMGDHGEYMHDFLARYQAAIEAYEDAEGAYVDVHSWYFTPKSARKLVSDLNDIGLVGLKCIRCYETRKWNNDFWMILQNKKS